MRSRVELFEQIRKDREFQGLSTHALARKYGVHRRTVRQALESPLPPARKRPEGRPAPKLGEWRALIDSWLEGDRKAPRKQRHTAKRAASRSGLSPREAQRRLVQYGPNEIRRREGVGHLRALAQQFTHPLALLLWAAGILALFAGIPALAAAIVAAIVLNAAFAFVQELQAEREIMRRPPRRREQRILDRPMLVRAWAWLGLLEAALVTGAFFWLLTRAGWSPGDATGPGSNLHHAYLQVTTITFAAITACQVGTAFATRTNRAALRTIGVFSNRLLLWGIAFEIIFAAAVVYLPPLQSVFGTASLSILDLLAAGRVPGTGMGQRRIAPMGGPTAPPLSRTATTRPKQDAGTAKGRLVDLLLSARIPLTALRQARSFYRPASAASVVATGF